MKVKGKKKSRLNMRIPSELLAWVKKYVRKRNTTVTQHYVDFLMRAKKETEDHG